MKKLKIVWAIIKFFMENIVKLRLCLTLYMQNGNKCRNELFRKDLVIQKSMKLN